MCPFKPQNKNQSDPDRRSVRVNGLIARIRSVFRLPAVCSIHLLVLSCTLFFPVHNTTHAQSSSNDCISWSQVQPWTGRITISYNGSAPGPDEGGNVNISVMESADISFTFPNISGVLSVNVPFWEIIIAPGEVNAGRLNGTVSVNASITNKFGDTFIVTGSGSPGGPFALFPSSVDFAVDPNTCQFGFQTELTVPAMLSSGGQNSNAYLRVVIGSIPLPSFSNGSLAGSRIVPQVAVLDPSTSTFFDLVTGKFNNVSEFFTFVGGVIETPATTLLADRGGAATVSWNLAPALCDGDTNPTYNPRDLVYRFNASSLQDASFQFKFADDVTGEPLASETRSSLSGDFKLDANGLVDCSTEVIVNIEKEVPKWRRASFRNLSKPARAEWKRFLGAVEIHEQGHINLIHQYFDGVLAKIVGKDPSAAQAIIDGIETELQKAHDQYDVDTQHGKTQGAKLHTTIQ